MKIIQKIYEIFQKNPVISTDSRNIIPSSIFFALKGKNFNGNLFAQEALNKGASVAIIDEPAYKKNDDQYIVVNNTLESLQKLATYHRQKLKITVIAITGSNGKTTTK